MIVGQKRRRSAKIRYAIYIAIAVMVAAGLYWLLNTTVQSASAPPTVKIGLVAPFEGLYRSTGYEVLFAAKLALQARNRGAGLSGYRVELVALNDFNDPAEAYRQAQALVADPDLMGVVGHFSSGSTLAALPVYQEAQLAVVVPWSVDASTFDHDMHGVASVAATYDETVAQLETVSRKLGFARLESVTHDDVDTFPRNAEAIALATDAVTAGNIALALHEAHRSTPLFGHVDVGNRQLLQVAGAAADGLTFVSPGPAANDVIGYESFIEDYIALAGFPPSPRALLTYDAVNILLDSIEQAMISADQRLLNNRSSRAEISRVLTSIQRRGITGEIAFDSRGTRIAAPVWTYQIYESNYPGRLIAP